MKQNSLNFEPCELCIFADFLQKMHAFFAKRLHAETAIAKHPLVTSRHLRSTPMGRLFRRDEAPKPIPEDTLPPAFHRPSSVVCRLSSVVRLSPTAFCLPPSIVRRLSSIFRLLLSAYRLTNPPLSDTLDP
jgi:hypothetical protein